MSLTKTTTPRGTRWYIDGRRVSRDAFELAELTARTLDTFHTVISGDTVRHHKQARP